MISQNIVIRGGRLLSHPVTNLFHLDASEATGTPSQEDAKLVLVDCRTSSGSDTAAWMSEGIAGGMPVLLLCPSREDLDALRSVVALVPDGACAALLVRSNLDTGAAANVDVWTLEYSLRPSEAKSEGGPSALARRQQKTSRDVAPEPECACIDFESIASAFVTPGAADDFKTLVEYVMDGRVPCRKLADTPPTGLKYFLYTYTVLGPFTYAAGGVTNGAGAVSFSWTVWGFLSQTATSNTQYLVVEAAYGLAAGSLNKNDECDRGFANAFFGGTLTAPMMQQGVQPTGGDGSFSGTVTFPVSYKNPLGGYSIWTYSGSVNNTVSSWSCGSASSGAHLGANWWMNSPCNGSNLAGTWKDAFNTWGHVGSLSAASSGSLNVNSVSAWTTSSLLSGWQSVTGSWEWIGVRFWGSSCSPGLYWYMNSQWVIFSWAPGFTANFDPINP